MGALVRACAASRGSDPSALGNLTPIDYETLRPTTLSVA
jgi:hypothetical protein